MFGTWWRARRDPETRARVTQEHARREGTGDAFDVAADAWEEAGRNKQAGRMRQRANELHVTEAIALLERRLEHAASEAGFFEYGVVEPRGDFWLSEDDHFSRGKSLAIIVPGGERNVVFEALIQKLEGPHWRAMTQRRERYGRVIIKGSHRDVGGGFEPVSLDAVLGEVESRYRQLILASVREARRRLGMDPSATRSRPRRSRR